MGICYIVAAMKNEYTIDKKPEDLIIAADGGYGQLGGCRADFVIGDFDSLGYVPDEKHVQVYPCQKDDTDMMLAVKLGLEKGYRQFVLLGGLGGRLDHTLANVQTLAYLLSNGAKGILKSAETDVYMIGANGQEEEKVCFDCTENTISFPEGTTGIFSVFSYGESAEGVQICGAQYELSDAVLTDHFPIGVSNCFTGREATISVQKGRLLVIHEKL